MRPRAPEIMTASRTVTEGPKCRLFGPFALEGGDGAPIRVRNRRARGLIAYLVFAGPRGASRERLSGLLWSDRGEDQARASLRQCLLELKHLMADAGIDALDIGREQIVLKPDRLPSDVMDIQAAIRDQDRPGLAGCLRAISADRLLDDFNLGGLFDEWLHQTRAHFEQTMEIEVRRLIESAESGAAWGDLRALAEAFLLRAPTDEAVAAAAMRADMALGSTSAAHRRFRALERKLTAEYGLRPSPLVNQALAVPSAASPVVAPQASRLIQPLVVVTAFEGADFDPKSAAIAQTLRDEVVSGLSRFRDLSVVTDPRPASDVDKADFSDPDLAFLLGARVRPGAHGGLTIQLVQLPNRGIIWSDSYEIPEGEILSATDAIVAQVVGGVLPSIDLELVRPRQVSRNGAYVAYLRAREQAKAARSHAEAQAAAALLEELIRTDPDFVLPYLPLASLYNTDFNYTLAGSSGPAQQDKALHLAKTAMSIDRGHVHSYVVAAWCYLRARRWEAASRLLDQALDLNPFNASRLKEIGFGLFFLDERERARELLDRCLLVNPTPDDNYFIDLGLLELVCGNYERAATYFELVANPTVWGLVYQAVTAELSGRDQPRLSLRARERIAAIWPRDADASDDAVVRWMLVHNPFRSQEVEDRFVSGVRMMLAAASSLAPPAPQARR